MKILIGFEDQVNIEVIKSEENEVISLANIIAALEFSKQIVIDRWKNELNKGEDENV